MWDRWAKGDTLHAIARLFDRGYSSKESMHVSQETIYRSLYIQARGVLKKERQQHLRTKRIMRRSKNFSLKRNRKNGIKDAIETSESPAGVEDRVIPGHREGDLIAGSKSSYIATLVERHSRYMMLARVKNKDTKVSLTR